MFAADSSVSIPLFASAVGANILLEYSLHLLFGMEAAIFIVSLIMLLSFIASMTPFSINSLNASAPFSVAVIVGTPNPSASSADVE